MLDHTAVDLGQRIRDARLRAGLTRDEVGRRAGLEPIRIQQLESGEALTTAVELSDVARALDVRMASLFSDPVPAVVSHRSRQGHDGVDSRIDALLSRLAEDVELVQSLAPASLPLDRPAALAAGSTSEALEDDTSAERLAASVRAAGGLSDDEPLVNVVRLAESLGLLAFAEDLGPDTADAGTILLRHGGVSLVNSHVRVGRRRLALGHELGHFVLEDEYSVDWRVATTRRGVEARLDRFARALLLPERALAQTWSSCLERGDLRTAAVLTASRFRVDMTTLSARLLETGLTDDQTAAVVRETSTTRTDIVEHDLLVPTDLEGTFVPPAFQKAVLGLCRSERISRERTLDLLRGTFDSDDLPEPRRRDESEVWKFVS